MVADYETEPLEGAPQSVSVVLGFDSKSAARAWYNSPEYEEIVSLRTNNTEGFILLADELTMPEGFIVAVVGSDGFWHLAEEPGIAMGFSTSALSG